MALSPDQEARAHAWAKVFEDGPATTAVLDDLTEFARALPETQIAGAMNLLMHILLRRSALRRTARRNGKGDKRG